MTAPLPFPDSVEWRTETALVDYPAALAEMEARAAAIHGGEARERVWLLEHAPLPRPRRPRRSRHGRL